MIPRTLANTFILLLSFCLCACNEATDTAPAAPSQSSPEQSQSDRLPSQQVKRKTPGLNFSVNAGADFWVDELEEVKLYGTVSAIDNNKLNVQWLHEHQFKRQYLSDGLDTAEQETDNKVRVFSIYGRDGVENAGFKAPAVTRPQTVKLYLVADDGQGHWQADDIEITINPIEPPPTTFSELDFPDKRLLECVNEVAGRQGISYIHRLKHLSCIGRGITSIRGIEKLVYLERLDLSENHIKDADYLAALVKLSKLKLSHNAIKDVSFVTHLALLQTLNLAQNPVSDLTFLSDLKQLKRLNLNATEITDLSPLYPLKQLKSLSLDRLERLSCNALYRFKRQTGARVRFGRCIAGIPAKKTQPR